MVVQITTLDAALLYAKHGLYIFPAPPGEKKSRKSMKYSNGRQWGMTKDPLEIRKDWKRWPDSNVCIVTGRINGLFVLETDTVAGGHASDGAAYLKILEEQYGPLPETRKARSPSGSVHYYFRYPESGVISNGDGVLAPGIDIRGEGGMVVAPPSLKPGAGEYEWINDAPFAVAPQWLIEFLLSKDDPSERINNDVQADIALIAEALHLIPNENLSWEDWNRIGMAAWAATSGHEDGYAAFNKWSAKSEKYNEKFTHQRWYKKYATTPPTNIGAGTIFRLANEESPGWRAVWEEEHLTPQQRDAKNEKREEFKQEKREKEEAKARKAMEKGEYTIKVYNDDIYKAVDLTEDMLLAMDAPFYIYGGVMATPITQPVEAMQGRKTMTASFGVVDETYLTDFTNRVIEYKTYNAKEKDWVSVDPPVKVISRLLARSSITRFPKVTGLITTQTMRWDGSLLLQPGYDPETGLLLIEPPPIPVIDEAPTRKQALAGLSLLEELIEEFPFTNDVAKAVALSALVTPVVRGAFNVAPMHVNRAPVAASGKSYLFDMVGAIATGQRMPATAAGRNDEETEKRLASSLLAGQSLINIDNVNGVLGGDALCQYIERPSVSVRVLGKSENRIIASRGISLFATGNNIILLGDLTRRVLISVLDPKAERPELREFKKNPLEMILANRGEYIAACLIICKAYMAAGKPKLAKKLGSFEGWSDVVRSALLWLGTKDPVDSMEIARDEDPDLVAHRSLIDEWAAVMGTGYGTRTSLSIVIDEAILSGEGNGYQQYDFKWPDFNNAVMRVASYGNRPPDVQRMGIWMRSHKGRVVDGMRFMQETNAKGQNKWWVEVMNKPDEDKPGLRATDNVVKPNFGDR